jgi:hypothetical protein
LTLRIAYNLLLLAAPLTAEQHQPAADPETVVVGNYWSESKPVLTIKSGDTVTKRDWTFAKAWMQNALTVR